VQQTVPAQPAGTCLLGSGGTPATDFPARTDAGATRLRNQHDHRQPGCGEPTASPPVAATLVSRPTIRAARSAAPASRPAVSGRDRGPATATAAAVRLAVRPILGRSNSSTATQSGADDGSGERNHPGGGHGPDDPLFTATGETNGGGDTGSVLISQYISRARAAATIQPLQLLRTMEDLFGVAAVARTRRSGPTSATPLSPVWLRSVPTCSTIPVGRRRLVSTLVGRAPTTPPGIAQAAHANGCRERSLGHPPAAAA